MNEHVHYRPGDCALLIGPAELLFKRQEAARIAGLRTALLCTGADDVQYLTVGMRALAGEPAEITGWMGNFSARLRSLEGSTDLAPLSPHADGHFDWVLDFRPGDVPGRLPPPGYYRLPADDFSALRPVLKTIAACLREGYAKPHYFNFDANLCAHCRQGVIGCDACQPMCPTGAIRAGRDVVSIEAHLCQGCGTCALVCPSGAVRLVEPGTASQLSRLRAELAAWRPTGTPPAGLWITTPEQSAPAGWLSWPLKELASLGLEFWLAALALGCGRVVIAGPLTTPMTEQINQAQALLAGLGLTPVVQWADALGVTPAPALSVEPALDLPDGTDKRGLLFAALDHLGTHGDSVEVALPAQGALSGKVEIDPVCCTLCGVCVRLCPSNALNFPGSTQQIAFTEGLCLQCGLCARACPERAIQLTARYLRSSSARATPRVVAEAEMFACEGCGKPFAPRVMIERSRAMMSDHPMFQGEQRRLMALCPDCRQKAMAGVST
jgi:Fe-S-cluster-containing hydrogenase component 2